MVAWSKVTLTESAQDMHRVKDSAVQCEVFHDGPFWNQNSRARDSLANIGVAQKDIKNAFHL